MTDLSQQQSRSEFWQKRWDNMAKSTSQFATMGRSSYTITDYFAYLSDIVKGLDGVDRDTELLDAAGGCGYLSMYFSPLVKSIDLFDYAEEAIKRAKQDCAPFANINSYVDNLLALDHTKSMGKQYKKILVGGPLQYFDNYDEIELILANLFDVTAVGGRVFVSQTTDAAKKDAHIQSYDRLDWTDEEKRSAIEEELSNRFWIDFPRLKTLAHKVGFSVCEQTEINPQLFQSTHMFDFYLIK